MRFLRLIAFLLVLGVVWVIGSRLWPLIASRRMDGYASSRIHRECGWESNCKVKAGELFEGKWDTVYVFAAGVTQQEMDLILGPGNVRVGDLERIAVLKDGNRIVRVERAAASIEKPFNGEIEFEDDEHRPQRVVRYGRDQFLRVIGFPIEPSGRFYVLTPTDEH